MYNIYCIKNLLNNKMYVGKTKYEDINKRFKEHIRDSRKEKNKDRPLYRAFNKYGTDNFLISLLETVEDINASERESFWIKELNTYGKNGYNATRGGDGSPYVNEDYIISLYLEHKNQTTVSSISGVHTATIRSILRKNGIEIIKSKDIIKNIHKKVGMFTLEDEIVDVFDNAMDAARHLGDVGRNANISACCRGDANTYLGYKWKRLE